MDRLPEGFEVHQTGDKVPNGYTLWQGVCMPTPMFNALSSLGVFTLHSSSLHANTDKMNSVVINCLRAAQIKPFNGDWSENAKSWITEVVNKFKQAECPEKHWVSEICLCLMEEASQFSQEWVEEH